MYFPLGFHPPSAHALMTLSESENIINEVFQKSLCDLYALQKFLFLALVHAPNIENRSHRQPAWLILPSAVPQARDARRAAILDTFPGPSRYAPGH